MTGKGKVMVIDDNIDILKLVSTLVESMNYEVVAESDGKKAVSLYQKYRPDVVLTDVMMPGVDGMTAFNEIMKCNPKAKVVFMTAYPEDENLQKFIAQTGARCLEKPLSISKLEKLASEWSG